LEITPIWVMTHARQRFIMSGWSRLVADVRYAVSFKGVASPTLRAAFADYELEDGTGVTIVRCSQEALRTVLTRIEDFGLVVNDVRTVG
jgi:hypothetical protein